MKIVKINEEQKMLFAALDPFEMLDRKRNSPEYYLGTVLEEEGLDVPTGLMICTVERGTIVIHWLYVEPKYRGMEMGSALLSAAFDVARKGEYKQVCAYLPNLYGRNYVCPKEDEYLRYHGFDNEWKLKEQGGRLLAADVGESDDTLKLSPYDMFEKILEQLEEEEDAYNTGLLSASDESETEKSDEKISAEEEVFFTAEDVAGSPLVKNNIEVSNVGSLNELTLNKLGRALSACLKKRPSVAYGEELYHLSPDWFDAEISSFVTKKDQVCGLFLVHKDEEEVFWTDYLFAFGEEANNSLLKMLRRSASAFVEKYPSNTKVVVKMRTQEIKALVEGIFPNKIQ